MVTPLNLPKISKEKLDLALRVFDETLRQRPEWLSWTANKAQLYAISENGKLYPPKKILSLASGFHVRDLLGGGPTNKYLQSRGFSVINLPHSSAPILAFTVGQVYDRVTEIHELFGGNHRSGIAASARYPAIFIFTGESGTKFGYRDEYTADGTFRYVGEGQVDDMQFSKGNKAVAEHAQTGKSLYVFVSSRGGNGQKYVGEYACASFDRPRGLDRNGDERSLIVFNLCPVRREYDTDAIGENIHDYSSQTLSIGEARRLALNSLLLPPSDTATAHNTIYCRSRRIADYVLRRSGGRCEACGEKASFLKRNGEPYLEPHHIQRLSDGGLDHPSHIGAVCPTCHREIHHGLNGDLKNDRLRTYVRSLERELDLKSR